MDGTSSGSRPVKSFGIGGVRRLVSTRKLDFTVSSAHKQQETYFMCGQLHYIMESCELVLNLVTELITRNFTCQMEGVLYLRF